MRQFLLIACLLWPGVLQAYNGLVDRYGLDHSGNVDVNHGGMATACWQFSGAVGAALSEPCGSYSATVNNAPTRIQQAGTWPSGISGTQGEAWEFDGATTWLNRADDGTFDPSDDFTVIAAFLPHSVAAGDDCLVAKWETTGNQRGWKLCRNGTSITFSISVDGTATAILTRVNAVAIHRLSYVTATYNKGLTTADIYVDNLPVTSSGAMPAAVHDSTADFEIAASDTGSFIWDGRIYNVLYVPTYMTQAQHDFMHAQWRGTISGAGNRVTVVSATPSAFQAAPADSGAEPFFFELPSNSIQVGSIVTGSGGLFMANAPSNLCHRASFETWAAGSPTGWTETSGGGTSDATQNTASMAHGFSSAQMHCDGVNTLTLDSACKLINNSSPYWLDTWVRTTAGVADFSVQLIEYTSADCSTGATTTTLYNGNPGANWVKQGGQRVTGAGVQSGRLRLSIQNNNATVLVDASLFWNNYTTTDGLCVTDADATAVCTHIDTTIAMPLLGPNEEFSLCSTLRTPVDVSLAVLYAGWHMGGTYGVANSCVMYTFNGAWIWRCWDSGAANSTLTTGAAAQNTDTYLCGSMVSDGVMWSMQGTTSYGPQVRGSRNAAFPEIQLGGYNGSAYVMWMRDIMIYRRIRQ